MDMGLAALGDVPWQVSRAAKRRVGFISGGTTEEAAGFLAAVLGDRAGRGLAETDTQTIDLCFANGDLARISDVLIELERRQAAVIVTHAVATTIVVDTKRTAPRTDSARTRSPRASRPTWPARSATHPV